MRSAIEFIMSPVDEAAFLDVVLASEDVVVIPQVRNPTKDVPQVRSLEGVNSGHCHLWDRSILAAPVVEYMAGCEDYYLRSEGSLIQLLRSPCEDPMLGAGRIALASTVPAMTAWYRRLQRWIKANFENTFVYASDHVPEVGSAVNRIWVGPDAIARSKRGWKLKINGPAEYSLHHVDPAAKHAVLARYRAIKRFIAIGTVEAVGEVVDPQTGRQMFEVQLTEAVGAALPFTMYEGAFLTSHPGPQLGDAVACAFQENVLGRVPDPWLARDIKKLTAKGRARAIQSLAKSWLGASR